MNPLLFPIHSAAPQSAAGSLSQEENDPESGLIGKTAPVTDFGKVKLESYF